MVLVASDDFNRSDESDIGAAGSNWVSPSAGSVFDVFSLVSNQVEPSSGNDCVAWYDGNGAISWNSDHWSETECYTSGTTSETGVGPAVRVGAIESGTDTLYWAVVELTHVQVAKFVGGSYSTISSISVSWNNGDRLRLEVEGSALRVFANGSQIDSGISDGSITVGSSGVAYSSFLGGAKQQDNWRGGDFSGINAFEMGTPLHDDTDSGSYTYPSATYRNNKLYVCFVTTAIASGTSPSVLEITGGGLTWVEEDFGGLAYSGAGNAVRRIQVFRALVTSGATTGSLTITLDGTSTGCHASVVELDGIDTSGSNGSGAVVQSASNSNFSETGGSVTLSAFGDSNNRPLAFFSHRATELSSGESGYLTMDDGTGSSPAQGSITIWLPDTTDTTPSATWSTSSDWGGYALEIKKAGAALPEKQTSYYRRMRTVARR